jgi:hypothetical protein
MIKQYSFLLFPILMFSCFETSKNFQVQKVNPTERQIIKINPCVSNEFKLKKGTYVKFYPNTFYFSDGELVNDTVVLTFNECYSPMEIVLNDLTTDLVDSSGYLQTRGMLNVTAISNNRFCDLGTNQEFIVGFARDSTQLICKLFKAHQDSTGYIRWLAAPISEELRPDPVRFDLRDTILTIEDSLKFLRQYQLSLDYYLFKSPFTGWVNCDSYVSDFRNTATIYVESVRDIASVRLLHRSRKTVSASYFTSDEVLSFGPLPVGEEFLVVGYYQESNRFFLAIEPVIANFNTSVRLTFRELSEHEFISNLKSIEW